MVRTKEQQIQLHRNKKSFDGWTDQERVCLTRLFDNLIDVLRNISDK